MLFKRDLLAHMKIGLVLSGGGAKGAYQAGVFLTMAQLGMLGNVTAISGTSIGAFNAALFASCAEEDYEKMWLDITYSGMLEDSGFGKADIAALAKQYVTLGRNRSEGKDEDGQRRTGRYLQNLYKQNIIQKLDIQKVKNSKISLYACAYNTVRLQPEYFKLNGRSETEIVRIILASSAIPRILPPVCINGVHYADGGINAPAYGKDNSDKIPARALAGEELDFVIVIYLNREDKADTMSLGGIPVIELRPSLPLEGFRGAGTLDFTRSGITERMQMGRKDSMMVLAPTVVSLIRGKKPEALLR